MMSRPCGVASSIRSASILDTIAVELIASAPPSASPACQPKPEERQRDHRADGRDRHLREAEPEHGAAHRLQLRQAEFEADREHQEHDAELGEVARSALVRHPAERVRADRDADQQVAQDRRQAKQPAGRDHDDGAAEQDQDQLQRLRHGGQGVHRRTIAPT